MNNQVYFDIDLNAIIVAMDGYYEYLITDALDKEGILKPPCKRYVYASIPETAIYLGEL